MPLAFFLRWRYVAAAIFCLAAVGLIALGYLENPPFSPDSWSYYELARSLGQDFYRIAGHRQYQFPGEYATSFPPLWPLVIFGVHSLTDLGIYAGYLANLVIAVITLAALVRFTQRRFGSAWIGYLLFGLLLANPEYIEELVAARSFPLATLLLILMIDLLWEARPTWLQLTVLGALSGLGVLIRFDYLPAVLMTALVVAWHGRSLRKGVLVLLTALLFMSPWIFYSWTHFGVPFVSDNSRTAILAVPSYVTDFYPPGQQPPSLREAPVAWTGYLIQKEFRHLLSGGWYFVRLHGLWAWLLPLVLFLLFRPRRPRVGNRRAGVNRWGSILWKAALHPPGPVRIGLILLAQQAAVALTGYRDFRYLIPVYLVVALFGFLLVRSPQTQGTGDPASRWLPVALAVLALIASPTRTAAVNLVRAWPPALSKHHMTPVGYEGILRLRVSSQGQVRALVGNDKNPWKLAALTGVQSFQVPRNLGPHNIREFLQTYQITHLYTDEQALIGLVESVAVCKPVGSSVCSLTLP